MEKQQGKTVGLENRLPWRVQQSSCWPTLSGLKPYLDTYQYTGPSEVNSCFQPSQLSYSVNASNSVDAAFTRCQQQFKFCGDILPAHSTAEAANSSMVNVVKPDSYTGNEKHANFGERNGAMTEGLNQVEFVMESSESCHKRFIIVDQTGSKARIIFHPALMDEFPNLLPNTRNVSDNINSGEKEAIQKIPSACTATDWGDKLTYRESMSLFQRGKTSQDKVNFDDGSFGFSTRCELSCNESLSLAKSEGYQSEFSEDTRDIEALLSSDGGYYEEEDDDEVVSTGHTPSNVIVKSELSSTQDSADVPRKRKRCGEVECNEQEVDFIPNTLEKKSVHSSLKCSSATAFENEIDYDHINDEFCKSVSNSVVRKVVSLKSSSTNEHLGNSSQGTGSSCKKLRIEKLKRTLDILRSVVPAGEDCKDTSFVLDVATRYLKSLQLQVEKLEAAQNHKDGITL